METTGVKSYRDLIVWRKALELVVEVYGVVGRFPATERFELSAQIRRAAVSVPANIAEGHARRHTAEYVQHLSIARGSLAELDTHLAIAERLSLVEGSDLSAAVALTGEVGRMLNATIRTLRSRPLTPSP